ncbi:reverse transcriptase domain-containing protein [Tanacetum coccineum]
MDGRKVERESYGKRPSERSTEEGGSHEGYLPPLLMAHMGRSENRKPLQSTLTFGYPYYAQPINPLPNASIYPIYGLAGLFTNIIGCITPFVYWIEDYPLPDRLKMPYYIGYYDMKGDLDNYLHLFKGIICMQKWAMPVACHMFTFTLKDSTQMWCNGQKAGSIVNYEYLKEKFRSHFSQQKKFTKTHLVVHNIKQRDGESTMAFVTRYNDDTLQILGLHVEQRISIFVHRLKIRSLVEFLSTDLPTTYKGLMEKTYTWIEAKEVATNGASNNIKEGFDKINKGFSWDNNKERKKNQDRSLRVNYKILLIGFSGEHSWPLREALLEFTKGKIPYTRTKTLNFVIVSDKIHTRCGIDTVFSSYEPNKVEEGHKKVKETNPEVTKDVLSCVDTDERIIYNDKHSKQTVVIGKQLLTSLKRKLQDLLWSNADVFAWTYDDMTRIPRTIMVGGKPFNMEHKLNEYKHIELVKQKKYQTWVANLVMVKKSNGRWRMYMDFTDINKACLKDCYPLPEIDWKVKSLSGYRKMPFSLNNVGATYQRLVDKLFKDQIRRNLKAYIDDMINPKKCSFDVEEGPLLRHLITKKIIKANPSKVKEITDLKPPRTLKEIQSYNGNLAALSRFISKGADRKRKETGSDLLRKQSIVRAIIKLLGIGKAHTSFRLHRKKATKAIELGEHDIEFKGRNSAKGQILADFLVETPSVGDKDTKAKKSKTVKEASNSKSAWKLYTDGASNFDGSGASLMLVSPEGSEYTYALRFELETTNNEAEYEALVAGLQIAEEIDKADRN